jgi:uncharacterized protein with PIN domain
MDDDSVIEITEGQIKRLKNLGPYKDKTDDEIRELILKKRRTNKEATSTSRSTDKSYDQRFNDKLKLFETEFAVDMNNSNDAESLNNLIRLLIQSEDVDKDIRGIQTVQQKDKDDVFILQKLGDFQRDLHMSIADLQDKLGITRKVRKEKAVDDIPQWIDGVLAKAKDFFDRQTKTVECPKCNIELVRYWINFPDLTSIADFTTECPHCGEIIKYSG